MGCSPIVGTEQGVSQLDVANSLGKGNRCAVWGVACLSPTFFAQALSIGWCFRPRLHFLAPSSLCFFLRLIKKLQQSLKIRQHR